MKTHPLSHSSVDYGSSPAVQASSEVRHPLKRGLVLSSTILLSSTIHPIELRQPIFPPRRRRNEIKAAARRPLHRHPESRTKRFQEATILATLAEHTPSYRVDDRFAPLKLPIQDVFEAIKGQPWVKRPKTKLHELIRPGVKDYYSFHDRKGHQTFQCQSLCKYFEYLIEQGYLREYILAPGASSESERQQETRL